MPSLGDASDLDIRAERRLGDRIARELYRDPDYIDDPVVGDYLQRLWRPLLAAARIRGEIAPELDERFVWEVMLGKDRSINAFALPGGYLGVHLGLIAASANRDELASVLAHELSHVTQRHIARMITQSNRQAPLLLGAMILGAMAASKNPQAAGAIITGAQAAAIQGQLNYSRDMEREADRVGMGILVQAGFEPQGFVTLFEKLQQASRLNDSGAFPYLRTHPLTTERIADMQARLPMVSAASGTPHAAVQAAGYTRGGAGMLEHHLVAARSRVLSQAQVDALRARVTEGRGVMAAQAAPTPAPPLAADADSTSAAASTAVSEGALYAAALASLKLRDFAAAEQFAVQLQAQLAARAARAAPGDAASYDIARQLVLLLRVEMTLEQLLSPAATGVATSPPGAPAGAPAATPPSGLASSLADLLKQWPLPGDAMQASRAHWLLWARSLWATGQADLAASRLQTWVALHPRDALAWQWLAQVQHSRGQTLRAIRAEAEAQAARLDYAAALDRLRAAQDLLKQPSRLAAQGAQGGTGRQAAVDHIEASIIDTRAREVAALLREQTLQR
ncbi:MAG: M48 family metalloprotease [Burkholderiaceae bacterium]